MEKFVLFRGRKTVILKIDDMCIDRIARIFQVTTASLYITDACNVAILPTDGGCFSSLDLSDCAHYEVHGEEAPSRQFAFRHSLPPSTANTAQLTRAVSAPSSFQRSIHVSDIMDGNLISIRVVVVRFVDAEATVSVIVEKVKTAMGNSEDYILTDTLGNEIVESDGTTGVFYWKQNARRIRAIERSAFRQWRRRGSRSRNEQSEVLSLRDTVEELLDASHGLDEVTRKITDFVAASRDVALQNTEIKQAFTCLICRDTMTEPMFSSCCRSLVGCRMCVKEWGNTSKLCCKCRDEKPVYTEVAGLSAALACLKSRP